MRYVVKTNKVGEKKSSWAGQVAYRMEDINKAWKQGLYLECFCSDEEPKRMIIEHSQIYKAIKRRAKLFHVKHGFYEMAYFTWKPTHINGQLISQPIEHKQKELF